jgi:hypothetical protein
MNKDKLECFKNITNDYELLDGNEIVPIDLVIDCSKNAIKVCFKVKLNKKKDNKDDTYYHNISFLYADCAKYLNIKAMKAIDINKIYKED